MTTFWEQLNAPIRQPEKNSTAPSDGVLRIYAEGLRSGEMDFDKMFPQSTEDLQHRTYLRDNLTRYLTYNSATGLSLVAICRGGYQTDEQLEKLGYGAEVARLRLTSQPAETPA